MRFLRHSAASTARASSTANPHSKKGRKGSGPYRGVRMRAWGKWVSEIRVPKTGKRIWLGSYDSPEMAARAYDAALYCIRGVKGPFNFPIDENSDLLQGNFDPLSKKQIQTIALNYASSELGEQAPVLSPVTNQVTINFPELPDEPYLEATTVAANAVDEYTPASAAIADHTPYFENLQLDDFLMLDIEWC